VRQVRKIFTHNHTHYSYAASLCPQSDKEQTKDKGRTAGQQFNGHVEIHIHLYIFVYILNDDDDARML